MSRRRHMNNEINAGSMADIAFLLLIFFLVTTTISEDKGILVKLPIWSPIPPPPMTIHERNVFNVLVNANNELLVRGLPMQVADLTDNAKLFINNTAGNPKMAESPTKAIISLQNDRGTSYDTYIQVYNELKRAYNELWEEAAMRRHGNTILAITASQLKAIKDDIPLVISEAEPSGHGEEN